MKKLGSKVLMVADRKTKIKLYDSQSSVIAHSLCKVYEKRFRFSPLWRKVFETSIGGSNNSLIYLTKESLSRYKQFKEIKEKQNKEFELWHPEQSL